MSFTFRQAAQSTPSGLTSSLPCSWSSYTPAVGDLLFATANVYNIGTSTTASMADNYSNAWSLVGSVDYGGSGQCILLYAAVVTSTGSGFTVTGTLSLARYCGIIIAGFSPSGAASQDGTTATASTTLSATLSCGPITTVGPSDLVVAVADTNTNGVTWTAGSGFTVPTNGSYTGTGSHATGFCLQYQLGVAAGSISPSITIGAAANMQIVAAAYEAAGSGGYTPWIYGDQIEANGLG